MVNGQPLYTVKVRALATAASETARRAEAAFILSVEVLRVEEREARLLGCVHNFVLVLYLGTISRMFGETSQNRRHPTTALQHNGITEEGGQENRSNLDLTTYGRVRTWLQRRIMRTQVI